MKKRWSPLKAALLWCLLVFVLALGRALLPVLIVVGIIAYAVQRSRLAEKK
ncbi:MAG TPA: hypothetical protein VF403_10665 [Kofleriaceae bacterium]